MSQSLANLESHRSYAKGSPQKSSFLSKLPRHQRNLSQSTKALSSFEPPKEQTPYKPPQSRAAGRNNNNVKQQQHMKNQSRQFESVSASQLLFSQDGAKQAIDLALGTLKDQVELMLSKNGQHLVQKEYFPRGYTSQSKLSHRQLDEEVRRIANSRQKAEKAQSFQDFYQSFTLRKYKSQSQVYAEQRKLLKKKQDWLQAPSTCSAYILEKYERVPMLQKMQLKQSLDEIQNYQQVASAYRQLKLAFANEEKVKQMNHEMEQEEKRIMMVHRNPDIARTKFPFNKRMGIEGFLTGKKDADGKRHVKVDDRFLMKQLNPKDKRVKDCYKFLECKAYACIITPLLENNYHVDFKKIRSTFEGVMWREEVKETINMQRFLSEKLKKENLLLKTKLRISNRKGKVALLS